MPTLLETQRDFARALLTGDADAIAGDIAPSSLVTAAFAPAECLAIYRNTFLAGLTNALALAYPAVKRLVGDDFFAAAAQYFIEGHPPTSAYLNAYGAAFPDFLAAFPPAATLSYLPDVARLEWAVNSALHAPDAAPLDAQALAAIAEFSPEHLILIPHPSVTSLRLDHPAKAIWQAVLAEDDFALASIALAPKSEWLLVAREENGVIVRALDEAEERFAAALIAGENFAKACEAVSFDRAPHLFAQHLAAGHFIAFREARGDSSISREAP